MLRIVGTILAGLLGLAFGSFLNVCLSRWPEGESIVHPRSHCRSCGRTLKWWENVPLVSWLALRGRCRTCGASISWRYPLVELAVGALWAISVRPLLGLFQDPAAPAYLLSGVLLIVVGKMILYWLLVALAVLDAENLWLPNRITLPGAVLGVALHAATAYVGLRFIVGRIGQRQIIWSLHYLLGILAAALLILVTRWLYWLLRRREGVGLGDAKLMAMLAAWLGLPGALLAFFIGVMLGAMVALVLLAAPFARQNKNSWMLTKLPLGTFLCVGGIVSSFWGEPIIRAYMRWAGF